MENNPIKSYNCKTIFIPENIKFQYLEKNELITTSLDKLNKNFRLIEVIYNNKAKFYNQITMLVIGTFAGVMTLLGIALIFMILI